MLHISLRRKTSYSPYRKAGVLLMLLAYMSLHLLLMEHSLFVQILSQANGFSSTLGLVESVSVRCKLRKHSAPQSSLRRAHTGRDRSVWIMVQITLLITKTRTGQPKWSTFARITDPRATGRRASTWSMTLLE